MARRLIFLFQSYHLVLRKLRRFKVILKLENQNTLFGAYENDNSQFVPEFDLFTKNVHEIVFF